MSIKTLAAISSLFVLVLASNALATTFQCDGFTAIFGAHEHMVGADFKIESDKKLSFWSRPVYPNSKWKEEGKFKVLTDNQMETTYELPGTQIFVKQYKYDSPQTNTRMDTLEVIDAGSFVAMSCKAQ